MRSETEITRKSFLSATALGLAGLTLLPTEAFAARPADEEPGTVDLRSSVGETFYVRSSTGELLSLRLERVEELRSDGTIEQFRLVFSGDERSPLAEGTWRLVAANGHRAGDVFLVPGGASASGTPLYRADFCLLANVVRSNPPR